MENQSIPRKTVLAVAFLMTIPSLHSQPSGSVSARVFSYFEQINKEQRLEEHLKRTRPKPVSPAYKARAIANLPPDGEVQPSTKDQVKLAALVPILESHDRSGVIEPKVIGDKEILSIGLYERCALIITKKALDLLSKEELQAVIAHELAHELFWDEYRLAREAGQDDKIQEIDLRCDGIAIFTLARLGLNPNLLVSAVKKMSRYSQETWGANFYVVPDERVTFDRAMIQWVRNTNGIILESASRK